MLVLRTPKNLLMDMAKHGIPSLAILLYLFGYIYDNKLIQFIFIIAMAYLALTIVLMSKPLIAATSDKLVLYVESPIFPKCIYFKDIREITYQNNYLHIQINKENKGYKLYAEITENDLQTLKDKALI